MITLQTPVHYHNSQKNPELPKPNFYNKSVVLVDPSRAIKTPFKAGVGPGMFDHLGSDLITIGCVFTTVVSALVAGIVARDIRPALVTFGVGVGSTIVLNFFMHAAKPKF